jgi:hypothetical protein
MIKKLETIRGQIQVNLMLKLIMTKDQVIINHKENPTVLLKKNIINKECNLNNHLINNPTLEWI